MSEAGMPKAYILHPSLVDYWNFKGKSNSDKDRNTVKGLLGNILTAYNFGWSLGSGYGLFKENYLTYNKAENVFVTDDHSAVIMNFVPANTWVLSRYEVNKLNATKVKIAGLTASNQLAYWYIDANRRRAFISIPEDGEYDLPESIGRSEPGYIGFIVQNTLTKNVTIGQIPEYPGAIVFDGVDDYLEFDQTGYKIGTIVCRHTPLKVVNWSFVYDIQDERRFIGYENTMNRISHNFDRIDKLGDYVIFRNSIPTAANSFATIGCMNRGPLSNFIGMALYDIALYEDFLTDTEIEKEITKMQSL